MPVMTRLDLKKMLLLASNKVEVVERMWKRMASVQLVEAIGFDKKTANMIRGGITRKE